MALNDAMGLVMRLLTQAQALAAVTARLRLDDMDGAGDPALLAQLDRVVDALHAREIVDGLSPRERAILVGFARSYLRQALELADYPARPGAWSHDDPVVLQAQGSASAVVATLFAEAGLGKPDARILDVGTGVGRLAIAFCEQYPAATVVGLDPWQPSLALARKNVSDAGLEERITLRDTPVESFRDPDGFDLVWFPSFFIPERVLDAAQSRTLSERTADGMGQITRPFGSIPVERANE
jgi:SAM-dependent methyltransferase